MHIILGSQSHGRREILSAIRQGVDRAMVRFRRIPEAVIDQVIACGDVFAYAGGFSITDPLLEAYIERVDGTAESVIDLPTVLTR